MPPTDDRHAIAMVEILRRIELFAHQRRGVVLNPLIALFDDDFTLGEDVVLIQTQVDHAVTLHLHHEFEAVRRNALKIGGVVIAREGIVPTAICRNGSRELARLERFSPLEQEVFKEMRDTRHARRFICRSCPVPDHMHHHRSAVIFNNDDLHAVVEREVGDHILGVQWHRDHSKGCDAREKTHHSRPPSLMSLFVAR